VQIILALVAALVLVAVPLYLWRRPQPATIASADAAQLAAPPAPPTTGAVAFNPFAPGPPPSSATLPAPAGALVPGGWSASPPSSSALPPATGPSALGVQLPSGGRVEIAPVKTLKCQNPGPGRTPPERCDGVRFFEDGLVRAVRDSVACAPPTKSGYVVSYVLEFHFGKKRANLFLGKSTTLAKNKRKELLRCVERALPTPEWDRILHQHQKYTLNTVVTYPPTPEPSPTGTP
jgi:hypothetical protein